MSASEITPGATYAEIIEGVRAALAAYTQALDDGRTDDVVATFCPDGGCDIPYFGKHHGHEALRVAYALSVPKRPQRHLVLNTLLTDWNSNEAHATSDVVYLLQTPAGWGVRLVGRYHDTLRCDDGQWRFLHRSAEFVADPPAE